ncbi:TraR/DksA C4-type zinc finger protein [Pseudomonas sp. ZM23]|uniref:TraR/DksA C4-type zinc finger protein n=1 Tax=Pseudomonas triclosanedens TaxID=2961893 RepID=A0ABY6ZZ69_9PSED|nr:TraR/DksA C4-type zinc finger protein [Pseudomonas triclosanedens]MCP8463081.1 TraR/DksA C4-type zinc finger protein [Pseudomonas triclosanedens]MCP8468701.1 TraR/DksA C4-type zinc finger protein [Pseudomonas triclosanedens]MCP8475423.1 TraR/DksA C4-type zinc finger protein [Pseudomonas triclosanedens]WAI50254.1 TraR/DksA C4-type zinc finger protein [Pseudomonas triclosanedens]
MADIADYANDLMLERLDDMLHSRRSVTLTSSAEFCEDCGDDIPSARRLAAPGCTRCIDCQALDELERRH